MSIIEIIEMVISAKGAAVAVALLSFVQIAPIKIHPWSWLGRAVGKVINGEVIQKVDELTGDIECVRGELKNVREEMGEDRAIMARVRILRFNDELLESRKHSKDSFDQCLSDVDAYEFYCGQHPDFKNNMTMMATKNIKRCYERCLEQHDFL